ncbi:beta-phosphoglucomutase [Legionella israelensis]|uniref:beta-phosphoglucomutase n=1 Tax=Legionella israelensis TaxID=454 RepID=UPI001180B57C|nr:beta-phosphoglucomutase [Legionella israelensis]QDP72576.1 beta-phosphoglucomutase [Legionella israelensis]
MSVKAMIFDLDGVITDTAKYHFQAWQTLANELDIQLDENDHEALKGIDRLASLELILAKASICKTEKEKLQLAERKNQYYRRLIQSMGPKERFAGVEEFLMALRQHGILIGLASSSKNAGLVIERLSLKAYFDYIADANKIKHGKPHPEIFLTVAQAFNIAPGHCIGVEDAVAGVRAIKAAGMMAAGIGNKQVLKEADWVFSSIINMNLQEILSVKVFCG